MGCTESEVHASPRISRVHLDSCELVAAEVGYGDLGLAGNLGYEDSVVLVRGQKYPHALSTHPPARLLFKLNGKFSRFRSRVALNDDVLAGVSHADFIVLADGRVVASANFVVAGAVPRLILANIDGAEVLELITRTTRWEYAHAVWLDPEAGDPCSLGEEGVIVDCLRRAQITPAVSGLIGRRCIATVASPEVVHLLDDMLGSLRANGSCPDALLAVFAFNADEACFRTAEKYGAVLIPCRALSGINPMSKAVLYSLAQLVDADQFLCMDADMLVLGSVAPIFAALEAAPEGSILACREGNGYGSHKYDTLDHAFRCLYGGQLCDWERFGGVSADERGYRLVINDGIFAANRDAMLTLDSMIQAMPQAAAWVDERHDIWWRNQFVFNLALARLRSGVELDGAYNVQLNSHEVHIREQNGRVEAEWDGRLARVLHFNGLGRNKYPDWRNCFARVRDPLALLAEPDQYGQYLEALRVWIGRYGQRALAWSFYGCSDGNTARVADATAFPLLALLHYVIRANGCVRVVETGTGRGVSTACIATAVAHRPDGHVATFDTEVYAERAALWAALPTRARSCIQARTCDSVAGMRAALAAGERYEAALLDSLHTETHVWAEFELAAQLVCSGGLILIHDATLATGTVADALRRIESAGYNVVRLWTAEGGMSEDDRLGLAVIENRRRHSTKSC